MNLKNKIQKKSLIIVFSLSMFFLVIASVATILLVNQQNIRSQERMQLRRLEVDEKRLKLDELEACLKNIDSTYGEVGRSLSRQSCYAKYENQ